MKHSKPVLYVMDMFKQMCCVEINSSYRKIRVLQQLKYIFDFIISNYMQLFNVRLDILINQGGHNMCVCIYTCIPPHSVLVFQ